jgi:hypothetical protein
MQAHPQSQMPMEVRRGKMFWEPRVAPGPFLFDIFQRFPSRDPSFAHALEELQRLPQIAQLIHNKNLRQKDVPHIPELRPASQPVRELPAALRCDLVHQAPRTAL